MLEFFETSGRNLLAAETSAGVRHHVALSIVGIDRTDNGYFRAKVAQEKLIVASGIPYTIIRATQFMEFLGGIAASSAVGTSSGFRRPVPPDRGGRRWCHRRRGTLAAPRRYRRDRRPGTAPFDEVVARYLKAVGDPREVVRDLEARYWGGRVEERSLVPWCDARLGTSVSTNGSAAHAPPPNSTSATDGGSSTLLCSLPVATRPLGSALAPKSTNGPRRSVTGGCGLIPQPMDRGSGKRKVNYDDQKLMLVLACSSPAR